MNDNTEIIKKQKEELQKLQHIKDCYVRIFNTEDGKKVLDDLKENAYYNQPTFVNNDIHTTLICEGQRMLLLHILTMADKNLKLFKEDSNEI